MLLLCLLGQIRAGDTLEAVRFEGARTFSRKAFTSLVAARPRKPSSETQLNGDAATLEAFYHNEGFHSVSVEKQVTRGKRWSVVTFRITEGPRTRVAAIAISGNATVGTDRLLGQLSVRAGRFFSQAELSQSGQALQTYYLNSGYPFVSVQTGLIRNGTLATLTFDISEGGLCHVSEVRVRGNKTVRTGIVLRASEIRPGERFSQARLREAQRRLHATKLFSRVVYHVGQDSSREEGAPGQVVPDSVVIRFDVTEQLYRNVGLGAGVEYYPARAIVSAEWEHNNLFGLGHTLAIGGEAGPTLWPFGNYRFAFDGTYRVPYLVLTRIDFQTHPYFSYERTDGNLQREIGIETGMSRNIVSQFTAGLTNRLRFIADTAPGITNSLALTGHYESRNDIFDPGQGLSVQVAAEGAGGPLGGDNHLYRLTGDIRWFQRLGIIPDRVERVSGDFVVALRGMAGAAQPYGRSESIPYYESFTLGGANSVRVCRDRSIGPYRAADTSYHYGPVVVNGNLELRSPYILRWVGLVAFLDVGSVARDLGSLAWEYGAGVGVRVKTPIGPVRLDWGKRLQHPAEAGRYYLGLLHAF